MYAPRARGVARRSAVFAAVLALTATTTFTASAQEDPVTPSTEVTAPSTPTPTENPPPSTPDQPVPPPTTEAPVSETPVSETPAEKPAEVPADKPEEKAAEKPADQEQQADPVARADVKGTAEVVGAGPFLVGQRLSVKLTVTNTSAVEATGLYGYHEQLAGPYFGIDPDSWGDLRPPFGQPSTTKLAAGESRTYTLTGQVNGYEDDGVSKFLIRVYAANDANPYEGHAAAQFTVREPVKTGTISGVLWGDANGNGVQDAGEGLAGAQAYLYGGGNPNGDPKVRTDAHGRFTFTGLELRTWGLNFHELPGGWVLRYSSDPIAVDGSGSTSELRYQAVRPLTEQLSASARFTSTEHVAGGPATVEITLTNRGGADITDVVEGCNRAGLGPHVTFPNGLGDLDWNKGATIRAGQSRVFTAAAVIPEDAERFGHAYIACDFGPRDGIIDGFPGVFEYVKIGDRRTNTYGSLYVDRDGNGWANGDDYLTGVSFSLVDPKTGAVVATASGAGEFGHAHFNDIPVGPYRFAVSGPWKLKHPESMITAEDCAVWCNSGWTVEVVPADEPGGTPGGGQPRPEAPVKIVQADPFRPKAGGLADTGASVEGLALAGALTLLLGGASIFLARRRTA
ncbi:LPXTG cell wall anchor domain-containing protein [Lentzea sp. NPDC058450]|uniref:LPXTG cell wall anchor domain-containing protein n=1 Tax=Lentzea sp. NPDC058450 TaxID=3346505 RepID=UPI00365AB361